jgi:hypothetical protein
VYVAGNFSDVYGINEKGTIMKTSTGFWDALFGERVTMEITLSNGSVKKVAVTKKWLKKMKSEGKVTPTSPLIVRVNIFGSKGDVPFDQFDDFDDLMDAIWKPIDEHRIEYWTVGEQIAQEKYEKFLDPKTKELYAMTHYEDGELHTFLLQKDLWIKALDGIRDI